jgi:hypothetical protein
MGRGQSPAQQLMFGRRSRPASDSPASADPNERVWNQLQRVERDLEAGHLGSALHILRQHHQAIAGVGAAPALDLILDRLVTIAIEQLPTELPLGINTRINAQISATAEKRWLHQHASEHLRQLLQTQTISAEELVVSLASVARQYHQPGPRALAAFFQTVSKPSYQGYMIDIEALLGRCVSAGDQLDQPFWQTVLPALVSHLNVPSWWQPRWREPFLGNLSDLLTGRGYNPHCIAETAPAFAQSPPVVHLRDTPTAQRTRCGHSIEIEWEIIPYNAVAPIAQNFTSPCPTCAPLPWPRTQHYRLPLQPLLDRLDNDYQQAIITALARQPATMATLQTNVTERLTEDFVVVMNTLMGSDKERQQQLWRLIPPQARQTFRRPSRMPNIHDGDIRAALLAYADRWDGLNNPLAAERALRETLGQALWGRVSSKGRKLKRSR